VGKPGGVQPGECVEKEDAECHCPIDAVGQVWLLENGLVEGSTVDAVHREPEKLAIDTSFMDRHDAGNPQEPHGLKLSEEPTVFGGIPRASHLECDRMPSFIVR
jgi:hypothetical protein